MERKLHAHRATSRFMKDAEFMTKWRTLKSDSSDVMPKFDTPKDVQALALILKVLMKDDAPIAEEGTNSYMLEHIIIICIHR